MDTVTRAVARWFSIRLPPGSLISAGELVCRQTVSSLLEALAAAAAEPLP
jgi:hypothetical protein